MNLRGLLIISAGVLENEVMAFWLAAGIICQFLSPKQEN
jgi:hypothetical protein